MATEAVTPQIAAPEVVTPASSPAPEATPVQAPPPAAAQPVTPVDDGPKPGESTMDFVKRKLVWPTEGDDKAGFDGKEFIKTAAGIEEADRLEAHKKQQQFTAKLDAAAKENAPAEGEKAAEAKTEDKPAEVKAEENPLDKVGPLPAETLAKVFTDHPELEETLKAVGLDKETLFSTSREAAVATQFKEVFPTVESAKTAQVAAEHFYGLDTALPQVRTIDDLDKFFMNQILPLTLITDEKGQPIKNPDGTLQNDGTLGRLIGLTSDFELTMLRNQADAALKANPQNEDAQQLAAALDIVTGYRSNGYKFGALPPAEVPPEIKQQRDQLAARESQITQQEQQIENQRFEVFEDSVVKDTADGISGEIRTILDKTALSPALKEKAAMDIYTALAEHLENNKAYRYEIQQSMPKSSRGLNDTVFNKRVAANLREMRAVLGKVTGKVLNDYGQQVISNNKARHQKIDTQVATAKMEPTRGATQATGAPKAMTTDEKYEAAKKEVLAQPGMIEGTSEFNRQMTRKILALNAQSA